MEYKNSSCVYIWRIMIRYDEAYCQQDFFFFCFIFMLISPKEFVEKKREKKCRSLFLLMLMLTDQVPYFLLTSYLLEANLKHVGF